MSAEEKRKRILGIFKENNGEVHLLNISIQSLLQDRLRIFAGLHP